MLPGRSVQEDVPQDHQDGQQPRHQPHPAQIEDEVGGAVQGDRWVLPQRLQGGLLLPPPLGPPGDPSPPGKQALLGAGLSHRGRGRLDGWAGGPGRGLRFRLRDLRLRRGGGLAAGQQRGGPGGPGRRRGRRCGGGLRLLGGPTGRAGIVDRSGRFHPRSRSGSGGGALARGSAGAVPGSSGQVRLPVGGARRRQSGRGASLPKAPGEPRVGRWCRQRAPGGRGSHRRRRGTKRCQRPLPAWAMRVGPHLVPTGD